MAFPPIYSSIQEIVWQFIDITKNKPILLKAEKLTFFETIKWEKKTKPASSMNI